MTPHAVRRLAAFTTAAALAAVAAPLPAHAQLGPHLAATPDGGAQFSYTASAPWGQQAAERRLGSSGALVPAQGVSHLSESVADDAVGVDGTGTALLAWRVATGPNAVRARRRAPDGSLGAVHTVTPDGAGAFAFRLAVEPDGDAVFAWTRLVSGHRVVQVRRLSAGGALGAVKTMSSTAVDADSFDLGVAPDGTALAVWRIKVPDSTDSYLQIRRMAPNGTLGAVTAITAKTGAAVDEPHVGVSDAGAAVFTWAAATPTAALVTRGRSPGGTLGPAQTVSPLFPGTGIGVATDPSGRTAYAFVSMSGLSFPLQGRIRQASGSLGPAFTLASGGGLAPAVALDPDGNATFAWIQQESNLTVQARRRTVSGALGTTRPISDPSGNATAVRVVVDGANKATLAWFDGMSTLTRTLATGGSLTPIRQVAP
ncbi:MAG TPA: hypothetical protein VF533_07170 [Solirubrobacteraceae bacterium]|jgi:hypothetical protein